MAYSMNSMGEESNHTPHSDPELSSTDESEDDASQGINLSDFTAASGLLSSTMHDHGVHGSNNVINMTDHVKAHLARTKATKVTTAIINELVHKGVKGVPHGKTTHNWFLQIVEHGHCDYVEHIKATRTRVHK